MYELAYNGMWLPWGLDGKASGCNVGDSGFHPMGRSPEKKCNCLLSSNYGQGTCSYVQCRKKVDMTMASLFHYYM